MIIKLYIRFTSAKYFCYLNISFSHLGSWYNLKIIRRSSRVLSDYFQFISDSEYESVQNFSIPTTTPPATLSMNSLSIPAINVVNFVGLSGFIHSYVQKSLDISSPALIMFLDPRFLLTYPPVPYGYLPLQLFSIPFLCLLCRKQHISLRKMGITFICSSLLHFPSHAVEYIYMYYPLSPFPSEYLLGYQAAFFLFQSIFDPFIQDHFIYFA